MEDDEFFSLLYQQWAKTTGAENQFWMSEADEEAPDFFDVYAVDHDQHKTLIATGMTEADADFVSGVHGCLADLIRRLHTAIDEAERFEYRSDEREGLMAELALDNQNLRANIADLETVMEKMDLDLIKANADVVYWQQEAHSYDWRNG